MKRLTLETYLNACKDYSLQVNGGSLWDFIRKSVVKYQGGKCPVYYIQYHHDNGMCLAIGGNFATNRKPELMPYEKLDF
jgi:hypothetical protein